VRDTGATDDLVNCMFRLDDLEGGVQGSWRTINVGRLHGVQMTETFKAIDTDSSEPGV
jgi:hypothetical protein